jgi:hypothetical protein
VFDPGSVLVGFVVDKVGLESGFCQYFCFPNQYHSTNAPHSYSSTYSSEGKRAKPGNIPKSSAISEIGQQ